MEAITVVGAGGIGCAIGYALCSAGQSVTFVETDPRKLQWGRQHGVGVLYRGARPAAFVPFDAWEPSPTGIVFLCTKCYDNAAVLAKLPPGVTLIPVQNGFDPLLEASGHALEGIASFVSECQPDIPVTDITRRGALHIGPRRLADARHPDQAGLAATLRKGGVFRVVEVASIEPYKYTKLMYNAAIAPIAAAAGIDNGQLLSVPVARQLFFGLLQENYAILTKAGVELGKVGPFHPRTVAGILRRRWLARLLAWAFEPSLRGTYCSMAPDLPKGRTEIDYYNRRLVDLAGLVPCPLNRGVVELIKRMERERIVPHRGVLEELRRLLAA